MITKIGELEVIVQGKSDLCLILAHGAGAPMDSEFMNTISMNLATEGIKVVRFEFPYMQKRRITGKKSPPDRQPKLLEAWREVINSFSVERNLFIGGKSMGGRMATVLAAGQEPSPITDRIGGVVCMGYPFHPPGKPEKLRVDHFSEMTKPVLILQGDRDPFGRYREALDFSLPDQIRLERVVDGNHDWQPLKKSSVSWADNMMISARCVAEFMKSQSSHR
ncbi:alpha/beta hydrolase [Oleiphilus messinensis]|uniref:Alpha/beta hydrolase n=1 Tax=Oleiphilus messinensis TaxID=141451 RepID=A0A1Y0I754_9GAMM|nr:alpha/beta family hydrolase [Oleiphilus messinensis]ARU56328.1 alpha/beta hydrolase [Oleiphilus messinensis]